MRAVCLVLLVALTRGMPPFSVGFDDHPKHRKAPDALPSYLEEEIEFAVQDAKLRELREHRR